MAGRGLHAATLLGLFGCGAPDVFLPLPPELTAGGSAILVVASERGGLQVLAASGDARRLLSLDLERSERTTITALQYTETLLELGLSEGQIPEVPPQTCGARPLPPQSSLHSVSIVDGEASAWQAVEAPPPLVQDVRIEGPCPCQAFDVAERIQPAVPIVAWFEAGERVLLLDRSRSFWTLDGAGELRMVDTATRSPPGRLTGVEGGEGEELWLSTETDLWRGSPAAGFTRVTGLSDDLVRHLRGGPGPDGFELYAATVGGRLLQVAPGVPRVLAEPLLPDLNPGQEGRVLWLGPGEVMASEHEGLDVFWMRDGVEIARTQLPQASGGVYLLKQVPQVGLLVVSARSRIFEVEGFEIRDRVDAPELASTRALMNYEDGYLYSGDGGTMTRFVVDFGFCPPQSISGEPRVFGLFPLGPRVGALALDPTTGEQRLLIMDGRPLEPQP